MSAASVIIALLVVMTIAVCYFVYIHRQAGKLIEKGKYYVAFILAFSILPHCGVIIHLHHYCLALLLLFATSIQTRISMVCQAFAIGLFIQAVTKWGIASPIQTRSEYVSNHLFELKSIQPQWNFDHALFQRNRILCWTLPYNETLDLLNLDRLSLIDAIGIDNARSFSIGQYLLVLNDVEVYRGSRSNFSLANFELDHNIPQYARVATLSNFDPLIHPEPQVEDFGNVLRFYP